MSSDSLKRELRQRWLEIGGIIAVTLLLAGVSRLETRLYDLSTQLAKDDTFIASIFFYGIINLNVFLAVILSFLVVRNIAKLVVDRRRGVFGSNLRTKLVATLMVFALIPTLIVFYVSTQFINQSFDEWFGGRVRNAIQQARDSAGQIYLQDQRRLEGVARVAASHVRVRAELPFLKNSPLIEPNLDQFESEYGIYSVRVFDVKGKVLWRGHSPSATSQDNDAQLVGSFLGRFASRPGLISTSIVKNESDHDSVRSAVPLRVPGTGDLAGLVLVEERFDMPFLRSLETIVSSFSGLKPGAQLLRVSYLILVTVMTLMIVFGAVWFGFRVTKTIIGPLQILAEATREVALGNYAVKLNAQADDETGELMRSFNLMTADLDAHRHDALVARQNLQVINDELERRRKYMEIVFANIAAGVIAVDARGVVTAFNTAAASTLRIPPGAYVGMPLDQVLGPSLMKHFWQSVVASHSDHVTTTTEIDLAAVNIDISVFVAMTAVRSIEGENLGIVAVFDDATERARKQRVTAWREVASRIAHEIKNPITPIKLSAERLLRRFSNHFSGPDADVFRDCLGSILTQVESLRNLVNEFGKFARLPAIKPVTGDVVPVIRSALGVFVEGYPQVAFSFIPEADLPPLLIDAEQLNRALVNVIANAVDAAVAGGSSPRVDLTCRFESAINKVVIEIQDNGLGIPDNIRDRIFDPYVSTKSDGTGLGLAITHQIVTDHGGYLRVTTSSTKGTAMRIELPKSPILA